MTSLGFFAHDKMNDYFLKPSFCLIANLIMLVMFKKKTEEKLLGFW